MSEKATTSFESFDLLGLKPFCDKLERYLIVEHDYVDGGLVVGLNAGFGSGKTTLIEMWENDLLLRRKQEKDAPQPVVLNAWKSDYCGDPLSAILAGLIDAVSASGTADGNTAALKDAAKNAAWFITGLANQVTAKVTGINVIEAAEFAESKKGEIPDFISLFRQRTDALKTLKENLTAVFGGDSPKVFVFVDELDRCRPDYAVNYLETIKHVFDIHGMVFVLAIDYAHLASSTKALFGQELDFEEYFRKFCHRVIDLPQPDETAFGKFATAYVKKYLEIEGKRACGINRDEDMLLQLVELSVGLQMRPRQLQEAFRIVGHACSVTDINQRNRLNEYKTAMIILFSFLKVTRPNTYLKIKDKKMPHEDVGRLLSEISEKNVAIYWFKIYLTGLTRKSAEPLNIEKILQNAGFLGEQFSNLDYAPFHAGWNRGHSGLMEVFRRIEHVESF
jgi:hypothetical protein